MSRWKTILKAWPPLGAIFVILSFFITAFRLWHTYAGHPLGNLDWLDPLSTILAGTGAFIVAAILIFRKVDGAQVEADSYGLARGLATGYYFNFVRPLVGAISNPDHPIHAQVSDSGDHKLEGLVVGLPQKTAEFDPSKHRELLDGFDISKGGSFTITDIQIEIAGRPRPVFTKLARSTKTKAAILVDIPTTLTVITDFAQFFAKEEIGDAPGADDAIVEARKEIVALSQTSQFKEVLSEFIDVMSRVGAKEPRTLSPANILHLVTMKRLRRRLVEVADH